MDWGLVLASQDIPATIVQMPEAAWGLVVQPEDYRRAVDAIRQYRLENRTWGWRRPIPWSNVTFDWGGSLWCILLILTHSLTLGPLAWFRQAGQFDTRLVAGGEWWRTFTAMLLHADLHHLLANTTTGFVLLGLAGARFGLGVALLATYLAGAAGNLAGLLLYPHAYVGMGASGMVMGALGLIAIPPIRTWSMHPRSMKELLQAGFASIMLFVLLGVDPSSDIIAHLGGFVAGLGFAVGLTTLPDRTLQSRFVKASVWLAFAILFTLTAGLAAQSGHWIPRGRP